MAEANEMTFYGENRSLFSDYYIAERLENLPEWDVDVSEPFQQTLELYNQKKAALPRMNEAQTEKEFIQPVLAEVLNHHYDVQHTEKYRGRINIPDYVYFDNTASLKEAQKHPDDRSKYYTDALALGDAKRWGRSLDGKGIPEEDQHSNANPSFQIVNYLTVTGLDWGILTNGNKWRLYTLKSRSRIDSYFEVDLKRILEEENEEQFKYFYHFFRAEAFREDPETGKHFLQSVFDGSAEYGTRLEDRLKGLIFDDVFLRLAKGYTNYRADEADIDEETGESLQDIYQGTLRLLYRLLFLLHAESRGLLPLNNNDYRQYSLTEIKNDVAARTDKNLTQSKRIFDIWDDLVNLFNIIDKGDAALNVPRYNGGLFRSDYSKNQFLTENKISDHFLVPALELLTREPDPETGHKRSIDYKSLNVEQLGSIYEGLLEFHLRMDDGELYLENDKGERKATGSYYTPHYIVEYIVEHTLGPIFKERAGTFKGLMTRLKPKYDKYEKLNQKIADGNRGERTHNKRKKVNLEIESLEKRATETLLSLKICDPAMGSGHFLKEATDKLAEKIITLLAKHPENPITNLLNNVRDDILQSMDEQEITIDAEEHLKDTNLIKRMVMKRCIYGVDLNPMAVELAKLSLWLDSFTVGAPLSFLDHHLKTGNSLIGTTVDEIRETLETGQKNVFGGPFSGLLQAAELMREVSVKTDATFSEVEQSIERYQNFEKTVRPYKQVLDIWISRHFGNERADEFLIAYSDQITNLLKGEEVDLAEKQQNILEKAEELQESKNFFHWELEFPEVFIDLKQTKWLENPGFDVVVGNPPYVTSRNVDIYEENKDYFDANFEVGFYQIDLYYLFSELVNQQTKNDGYWSFIIPDPWLGSVKGKKFRKWLTNKNSIKKIGLPKNKVFEADVDCLVLIAKLSNKQDFNTEISKIDDESVEILREIALPKDGTEFPVSGNAKLFNKLNSISIKLEQISLTGRGIGAYHKSKHSQKVIESRAFHSDHKKDDTFKPELGGENIGRYQINWSGNRWISYGKWLSEPRDPDLFQGPRILCRKILSDQLCCTFVDEDWLADQQVYVAAQFESKYNPLYANALFASTLLSFYSKKKYHEEGLFPHLRVTQFRELPIREIDFSKFNPDKNRQYPDQLEQRYHQYLRGKDISELLHLSDEIINDKEEYRLPVIHDFLAYLTEQMLEFNKEKQRLNNALDPFKFLNKGVAFKTFSDVFSEAIKYGEQLTAEIEIGAVHHDIEGLRLVPEGDKWLLKLQLKHRDAETEWADWVREDGHIVRTAEPVYRFELSDREGRYWQQAFEVLEEFNNSSTFPGGKTRTTHEKLMKSNVPVFDKDARIKPLMELREELAETEEKIEKTDGLIDQVVYRLYGLSEEEIAVVEGSVD